MTVCQTPDCPAARERDEFGRLVSVQHGGITQPVLGATGHHLLNRWTRGELAAHLRSWGDADLISAMTDIEREQDRVSRYLEALEGVQIELLDRYGA